ncbi:S8/S53 family peptidase [Lichenicola cladoniae]|uniref:S8/S53 family peptidase n=1 Tax=Lichenicola cladoniae TaxID=1484109 RepID=A0A6M8HF84_9PROT|nr:S53 family peptidase [Lichenicola cladoniae]NPD68546.1 S8/S53 family peptidase [Acetobacteraceae bacterium]QKE88970.1 S8/S53 family peptidase [Lichenicola cladoniae]
MTETRHSASTGRAARTGFRTINGSCRALPEGSQHAGDVPADHIIEASIYLQPRDEAAITARLAAIADPDARRSALSDARTELYRGDMREVSDYATLHGLTVTLLAPARRLIRVAGSPSAIEAAFGTKLSLYRNGSTEFRGHDGDIQLPEHLHALVESVLGLDSRAVAHTRIVRPHQAQPNGLEPNKLAVLYDFPTGVDGTGVTIALIELGGGFSASDNTAAFKAMGLKVPRVIAVSVDGGLNTTGSDADGEVALDIQVAGGLAPGAELAVYFAPNTDAGFSDAISQAVHDTTNKPSVISISWGGPESSWTSQSVATMNSVLQDASGLGISVYVASGDSLATDGVDDGKAHVDFPASSPYAIGCGGTHIDVSGSAVSSEVVWNDGAAGGGGTGGGISDLFDIPTFQAGIALPASVNGGRKGRGVPDVAGDAAPGSGYLVVVGGKKEVVGGTSAVAPLWAGLTALINQKARVPVGFLPDFLYPQVKAGKALTVEITTGDNKPEGSALGYAAGPVWNACTGLGRPDGKALFAALTARTATATV